MNIPATISRRAALMMAGGAGVGAVVSASGAAAFAQEGTPGAQADSLPPGLAEWVAAWETFNLEGVAAAFAEEGIHEDVAQGIINVGPEAILTRFTATVEAFPNAAADIRNVFADESRTWGAIEWVFSGAYSGQLPGFPAGQGQPVVFRGASIIELANGHVIHERWYYDLFAVLVQMGMLPAPDGAPGATPAT